MSDNKEMIGYEEISNDPDLQEAAAGLLHRFPNGAVSDLLNVFFSNKDGDVVKDILYCRRNNILYEDFNKMSQIETEKGQRTAIQNNMSRLKHRGGR